MPLSPSAHAQYLKRQYRARVAEGMCTKCGRVPATTGVLCGGCSAKQKRVKQRWWQRIKLQRKAGGICTRCGHRPATSGSVHCKTCQDYKQQHRQAPPGAGVDKPMNLNRLYKMRDQAKAEMEATEAGQRFRKLQTAIDTVEEALGVADHKMASFDRALMQGGNGHEPSLDVEVPEAIRALPPESAIVKVSDQPIYRGWRALKLIDVLVKQHTLPTKDRLKALHIALGWAADGRGAAGLYAQMERRGYLRAKGDVMELTRKGQERLQEYAQLGGGGQ